jgi:hypothetical protein
MEKSIFNSIYKFINTYFTFILIFIVFIINYYILYISINIKEQELTLQEYYYKSLQIQFIPLLFIIFIVIPSMFYLMYRLYTIKEKITLSEIFFSLSVITGFYNLSKSIIIIYNNYDKAKMATYGKNIETPPKINIIYKSLINDDEYSNIDILYKIWFYPILSAIIIAIFNLITSYYLNSKDSNQFIIQYLFKRTNVTAANLTIEDIINLYTTLSGDFITYAKLGNNGMKQGLNYLDDFIQKNPQFIKTYNLDKFASLIANLNKLEQQ